MLLDREVQLMPPLLLRWLAEQRITFAFLTTQLAEVRYPPLLATCTLPFK